MTRPNPARFYAAEAGVASIDHAAQLSDKTMALMKEKHIPAVPTFQVMEFFAGVAPTPAAAAREHAMLDYKIRNSNASWRRACPSRWDRMWGRSPTACRDANSS